MKFPSSQKGFTVIYAVLISSLLLSIGLGIYSISIRDFILASSASESQKAIFAADSGIECALYWDYQFEAFPTSTAITSDNEYTDNSTPAYCGQTRINDPATPSDTSGAWSVVKESDINAVPIIATTTFTARLGDSEDDNIAPCVTVTVTKTGANFEATFGATRVEARGYNTCITENPRRVERAIRVQY